MRRTRRGGGSGLEFGGSGEDSFVAVVVTKLTGALLFILLLTMVIMALLPKAVDMDQQDQKASRAGLGEGQGPLTIATPSTLPDAVAGRPYLVAMAATGGRGPLSWSAEGAVPPWLSLDKESGRLAGLPPRETSEPVSISLKVIDGSDVARQSVQLVVLPAHSAATNGTWWKPRWPSVPWRAWMEQGVGFLILWLVHLLGMNLLANLERHSHGERLAVQTTENMQLTIQRRFTSYRILVRLATLCATIALIAWLWLASTSSL